MTEHHINSQIVREIEQKKKELSDKEECIVSLLISRYHKKASEQSAIRHSLKIEYPNEKFDGYSYHASQKKIKEILKNLKEAHSWADLNFDSENINEEYLNTIAGKITPERYSTGKAHFRKLTEYVIIPAANWMPHSGEVLQFEMEDFLKNLKERIKGEINVGNYFEASCYAHYRIARIHPFRDGNGRTSRLIQNILLKKAGLPPVDILPQERLEYYKNLREADEGYMNNCGTPVEVSKQEANLYNYFAKKVSSSLDLLLKR